MQTVKACPHFLADSDKELHALGIVITTVYIIGEIDASRLHRLGAQRSYNSLSVGSKHVSREGSERMTIWRVGVAVADENMFRYVLDASRRMGFAPEDCDSVEVGDWSMFDCASGFSFAVKVETLVRRTGRGGLSEPIVEPLRVDIGVLGRVSRRLKRRGGKLRTTFFAVVDGAGVLQ